MTEEEKYNEMLASISMSRMKELGLKPPETIANLESLPPKLGEKLNNLTEQAMSHVNKTKIDNKLQGTEKIVEAPPGPKKPSSGKGAPQKITVLRVPSSPGQELVEEIPGVTPLDLPGEETSKDKKKGGKKNKGKEQKAKPPPAQEGGPDDSELSVGESGDEGPAPGQEEGEDPIAPPTSRPKVKKLKPKKNKELKKKKKKLTEDKESKAPEVPSQLKNPDLKIPQQPYQRPLPPSTPSQNYLGVPGFKKHKLEDKKKRPFSITFAGKKLTNVDTKTKVEEAENDEEIETENENKNTAKDFSKEENSGM